MGDVFMVPFDAMGGYSAAARPFGEPDRENRQFCRIAYFREDTLQ